MSCITAALNDPRSSIIGDPRRGTYAVSFTGKTQSALDEVSRSLEILGIAGQISSNHPGTKLFLTVYTLDDQQRLLVRCGPSLEFERLTALEILVQARGPVPEDLLHKLRLSIASGRSHAYLAGRLNELGIITGMGGLRWTAKKIKKAVGHA